MRQSVVAQNVANSNTPGYKAMDVEPFEAILNETGMAMKRTQANHLTPQNGAGTDAATAEKGDWAVLHSGNSVILEEQMLKAGEISGSYARNTSVMKTLPSHAHGQLAGVIRCPIPCRLRSRWPPPASRRNRAACSSSRKTSPTPIRPEILRAPIPIRARPSASRADLDDATGAKLVKVDRVDTDNKPFRIEHDPSHPAADADGNVKMPNVDLLVELADMRETNRSYEANLQVVKQARSMISMTIDLLRSS